MINTFHQSVVVYFTSLFFFIQWYIFVSQLWQPMPCLIWAAAIIEAGIQVVR